MKCTFSDSGKDVPPTYTHQLMASSSPLPGIMSESIQVHYCLYLHVHTLLFHSPTTVQQYINGPYTLQICYLLLVVIVVHQILFCQLKEILWQFFCCTVSLFSSLSAPPLSLPLCGMFLLFSLMHIKTAYRIVSFSAFLLLSI